MNETRQGKRTLYRSRRGKILGVCQGVADYFSMPVKWIRIVAVVALVLTGFWPAVAIYLGAAFLLKPEPAVPTTNDIEEEFYNSYTASRSMAVARLRLQYERLNRRIQRMESAVCDPAFDWQRRLEQG